MFVGGVILTFGDFGFDKPGRQGLDFGHLLLICGLYALALVVGITASVVARSWLAVGALIAAVIAPMLLAVIIEMVIPLLVKLINAIM